MQTWIIPNATALARILDVFPPRSTDINIVVWRDTLYDGPVSAHMTLDETLRIRMRYLADTYSLPFSSLMKAGTKRNEDFISASKNLRSELVIWNEPGMASQACLAQIIDELCKNERYELISLANSGVPLWGSSVGDLQSIYESRLPLSSVAMDNISEIWKSYIGGDVQRLAYLTNTSLSLPGQVVKGFARLLRELPDIKHSLDLTDLLILRYAVNTPTPSGIFSSLMRTDSLSQLEDLNFTHRLLRFLHMDSPLLRSDSKNLKNVHWLKLPEETRLKIMSSAISLTEAGETLLEGNTKQIAFFPRWFGGFHCEASWSWCMEDHFLKDRVSVSLEIVAS